MNTAQPSFDTVTEALQWLNTQGFTHDLNLEADCLSFDNGKQTLTPEMFTVTYMFRFEGDTDPGDEEIVYGITSETHGIKGVLTSAFGTYADTAAIEMIKKLR